MNRWSKILSAYLVLFAVAGSCVLLKHHNVKDHNNHHHGQHVEHPSDGHDGDEACHYECSCQKFASIPSETSIIDGSDLVFLWSYEQTIRSKIVLQALGHTLARDGPLFEGARAFSKQVVIRT